MCLRITTHQLNWFIGLFLLWFAPIPAFAAPLSGTGPHLPIPSINPAWPVGTHPTRVNLGGNFTGTWTTPVQPAWVGTFTANGPIPGSTAAGLVQYDFTSLPLGYLPAGTFFVFGDIDQGSTLPETAKLTAFDASGNSLATPWLDETHAVRGPGTGTAGTVQPGDMPGWSWNDSSSPNTYVVDGSTIITGNPSVAFALTSNQPIYTMELNKLTTHYGFGLAAPDVPEPTTLTLACFGSLALVSLRRRRFNANSSLHKKWF